MDRLRLLIQLAWQNVVSHRAKSSVVILTTSLGMFVVVVGLSLVQSIDQSMRQAVSSSITGHIQVWSDEHDDEIRLIDLGGESPVIGSLEDFQEVEKRLLSLDSISTVVPMGLGGASTLPQSETDLALQRLREAVAASDQAVIQAEVQRLKSIASSVEHTLEQRRAMAADDREIRESLKQVRYVLSDSFWDDFESAPDEGLMELDTEFAPLTPEARPVSFNYIATDFQSFAGAFERMRVVEGERVPDGRRGFMMPHRFYESRVKHPVARDLDRLKDALGGGMVIKDHSILENHVAGIVQQRSQILIQLSHEERGVLRPELQASVDRDEESLDRLLEEFFQLTDDNFEERYEFFYAVIAPLIELHRIELGESVVLRAITSTGYTKSVEVPVYGTFEFDGLESAGVAGMKPLLDLVTFRELFGQMSDDQLEELKSLRDSSGIRELDRDSAEEALFGDDSTPRDADVYPDVDAEEVLDFEVSTQTLADRSYSAEEMRGGLVLSAAVFVNDFDQIDATIEKINAMSGLQATDWKAAAGLVGQTAFVLSAILIAGMLLIFLLTIIIINNALTMTMMERVPEIGTIRAIGGHRTDILLMVLLETVFCTLIAGVLGGGAALLVIAWLGSVGIPAPTGIVALLFGGERLFLVGSLSYWVVAYLLIVGVSLISSFLPARFAIGIKPVVAMRGS